MSVTVSGLLFVGFVEVHLCLITVLLLEHLEPRVRTGCNLVSNKHRYKAAHSLQMQTLFML